MTCRYKYIRCVFSVEPHVTNYYYNKTVMFKNTLILEMKTTI